MAGIHPHCAYCDGHVGFLREIQRKMRRLSWARFAGLFSLIASLSFALIPLGGEALLLAEVLAALAAAGVGGALVAYGFLQSRPRAFFTIGGAAGEDLHLHRYEPVGANFLPSCPSVHTSSTCSFTRPPIQPVLEVRFDWWYPSAHLHAPTMCSWRVRMGWGWNHVLTFSDYSGASFNVRLFVTDKSLGTIVNEAPLLKLLRYIGSFSNHDAGVTAALESSPSVVRLPEQGAAS